MVIKDTSWHYLYIKSHGFKKIHNVCLYSRAILLSLVIDIAVIGFVTIFGASTESNGHTLLPVIWEPGVHGLSFMIGVYFLYGLVEILCALIGCFIAACIIIGVMTIFEFLKEKAKGVSKNSTLQSNPLIQYVKDKHSKMCTTITIKERD